MDKGIYILANDNVYDQLVAFLNSIEANYGKDIPVCVIPYDGNISRISQEIKARPNVTMFENSASIVRWEEFTIAAWSLSPGTCNLKPDACNLTPKAWGRHKLGVHRKLCCFNGPFEKFVYMDADTLLMQPLDFIFERLDKSDFVVYDYQYKDPSHVYDKNTSKLFNVFSEARVKSEIFCSGFFAAKCGLFDNGKIKYILEKLKEGDAEILYPSGADQSLLNYMVMRNDIPVYNFALELPYEKRTGNSVTSKHFEEREHILYDRGNRLTYLHYIGTGAEPFRRLCQGQNIAIPYHEIFLHYRYLHEPENLPKFKGKPKPYSHRIGFLRRAWRKIKR